MFAKEGARVLKVGADGAGLSIFRKETRASPEREQFPSVGAATRIVDHPKMRLGTSAGGAILVRPVASRPGGALRRSTERKRRQGRSSILRACLGTTSTPQQARCGAMRSGNAAFAPAACAAMAA